MSSLGSIIGGVLGIGGSLFGAHSSSSAANHASDVAAQAAASNNALQSQIYNSNKDLIQPTVDRGNQAADELSGFLGLGGDPAKTQAAFNTYLNSTGYQFERGQGIDAASQSKAAEGLFNSGAALKALDDYGTGVAQKYGQQYVDNLGGIATRGVNGVNALTGAGTNYANAVSSNNNSAATASGNAGLAAASNTNDLIGNAFKAFGAFKGGNSFGASSYGGGGSAAATSGAYGGFGPGG